MNTIKLENWAVVYNPNASPYTPPELLTSHLVGEVNGHSRFPDGHSITTSPIIGKKGSSVVTKSGSVYSLGKVDRSYSKQFPQARKRLFDTLPES